MHIYLKNNRANFQSDSTWNDGALRFFEEGHPNKKKKKKKKKKDNNNNNNIKMSSDMESVPDPKLKHHYYEMLNS